MRWTSMNLSLTALAVHGQEISTKRVGRVIAGVRVVMFQEKRGEGNVAEAGAEAGATNPTVVILVVIHQMTPAAGGSIASTDTKITLGGGVVEAVTEIKTEKNERNTTATVNILMATMTGEIENILTTTAATIEVPTNITGKGSLLSVNLHVMYTLPLIPTYRNPKTY